MEINGYKIFNYNMKNMYDITFEVGKSYKISGIIKYGTHGNGYHFCKYLEDTIHYVNTFEVDFDLCEVIGKGIIVESENEYYDYYFLYSCSELEIVKKLTRKEIINYAEQIYSDFYPKRLEKIIKSLKLTQEEIKYFYKKFINDNTIINALEYYQLNNKNIYETHKRTLTI